MLRRTLAVVRSSFSAPGISARSDTCFIFCSMTLLLSRRFETARECRAISHLSPGGCAERNSQHIGELEECILGMGQVCIGHETYADFISFSVVERIHSSATIRWVAAHTFLLLALADVAYGNPTVVFLIKPSPFNQGAGYLSLIHI